MRCTHAARLLGDNDGDAAEQRPTALRARGPLPPVRHPPQLPTPEINATLNGHEVDALYRAQKLIIDVDGYKTHSDRQSFERDRLKDAEALADGHVTVRITDQRLKHGGAEEAVRIRTILDRRGRETR